MVRRLGAVVVLGLLVVGGILAYRHWVRIRPSTGPESLETAHVHGTSLIWVTAPVGEFLCDERSQLAARQLIQEEILNQTPVHANASDQETEVLPKCGLQLESPPNSIISFFLPTRKGDYQQNAHPRLAVLAYVPSLGGSRLQIFRFQGNRSFIEFQVDGPKNDPTGWTELESFPTGGELAGVIIWGSAEGSGYERNLATVVCYVQGKYQVVFRGYDAEFIDIGGGGIPDAVSTDEPTGDYSSDSSLLQVWTWSGERYVPVAHVPYERLFSPEVIRAVRAAKKVKSGNP